MLSFYHYEARKNSMLFISLLMLFFLHVLSVVLSDEGIVSRALISLIIFITCYLYFSFVFYNDNTFFEHFYVFITVGLILNFIAALMQKAGFNLGTSYYEGYDRYTGLFANPNQLAIVVTTTFIFYVDKIETHQRLINKLFALAMVGVCFMLLLLAGSKTNIIVSFLILLSFFVARKNMTKFIFGIIFLFLALFLIKESGVLMSVNPRLFEILFTLSPDTVLEYRTVASRIEIWEYSWKVGTSYPYLGEGLTSTLPDPIRHSHNIVIDYMRMFGPAGFVTIICFIYAIVSYRIYMPDNSSGNKKAKICKISIIAYLLSNMMSDSMGPQTVFFFAFFVSYLSVHSSMFVTYTNINKAKLNSDFVER
ncbi:O-antigen ligase family protein [Vibrio sp. YIC-376]|uniref:O-antigen ligase family protein n=1 Tax=Vibrio sp. YIC-376 TaxID=3136162 RepID=UPI00402AEF75